MVYKKVIYTQYCINFLEMNISTLINKLPHDLSQEILKYCKNLKQLNWFHAVLKKPANALLIASKNGNLDIVSKCIDLNLHIDDYSEALQWAAYYGHTESVEILIPVSDLTAANSCALQWAAGNGQTECLKLLINVSDLTAANSCALQWAAYNGHLECVKLLIPVSDPTAENSWALRCAAQFGRVECLKLLIPVSDPTADDSEALRYAAKNWHSECVKLLIPVSDPVVVKELGLE